MPSGDRLGRDRPAGANLSRRGRVRRALGPEMHRAPRIFEFTLKTGTGMLDTSGSRFSAQAGLDSFALEPFAAPHILQG